MLNASAVELGAHERERRWPNTQLLFKDLQETKAELQETKAALQEAKVEQTETKAELRNSKRKLEPLEHEVASLKATRATQGAHEGSPTLVGSDRSVSGSHDKTLKVWRLADRSYEKTFERHGNIVSCVAVLPGGEQVVSVTSDNTLEFWRLAEGSCEKTLEGHRSIVFCVAEQPGGERVVSGSHDDTLKVWRLAHGSCETILQGHKRVRVFCVAVLPGGDRVVSCSCDNTLKVWRLSDGTCEKTLQDHAGLVGVAGGKLAAEPRRPMLPCALRKQRPVLGLVVAPAISITARQSPTNKGRPTLARLDVLKSGSCSRSPDPRFET